MKSGNLSLINRCVPSMCFTDSPSFSGCCCKTISRKKKSPANTFSELHTHDRQDEILTVIPSHIQCAHTHASPRWTWRINFTGRVHLPLRLKWNHTVLRPPSAHLEVLLQKGHSPLPPLLLHSPHQPQHRYKKPSHCVRNYSTHAYVTKQ